MLKLIIFNIIIVLLLPLAYFPLSYNVFMTFWWVVLFYSILDSLQKYSMNILIKYAILRTIYKNVSYKE